MSDANNIPSTQQEPSENPTPKSETENSTQSESSQPPTGPETETEDYPEISTP